MEANLTDGRLFVRMRKARLHRIANEGAGQIIRLTFVDDKNNCVQIDMSALHANEFRKRLNKRKDF